MCQNSDDVMINGDLTAIESSIVTLIKEYLHGGFPENQTEAEVMDDIAFECSCLECDSNVTTTISNFDGVTNATETWRFVDTHEDEHVLACECQVEYFDEDFDDEENNTYEIEVHNQEVRKCKELKHRR